MAGDVKTPALLSELRQMAENGQIDEKMVPRLTLALQIDIMEELAALRKELREHTHADYVSKEEHDKLSDEVQAWKNRALGIGIGAALAGGGVATAIVKIFWP